LSYPAKTNFSLSIKAKSHWDCLPRCFLSGSYPAISSIT